MKRLFGMLLVLVFAAGLATACGGDEKAKGPVYPACSSNGDCADHGEFCLNGTCSECAKSSDCKGACTTCAGGKCEGKKSCCTGPADCPEGTKCIVKPGKKEGTCGNL